MAKSKRGGKSYASGYANYKNADKEVRNRTARLTKLAIENPNNKELELAIKNVRHRRHVPKTPFWSHSMRDLAKVVKIFTGKFSKHYFSTDPDLYNAALRTRNENKFKNFEVPKIKGSMFSIGERLGWKF